MNDQQTGTTVTAAGPMPVEPPVARRNPLRDRAAWQAARSAAERDPGACHGAIARREIHWFDAKAGANGAWITWSDEAGRWVGFDARSGAAIDLELPASYQPWERALDTSDAPFYRWFSGGLTNACFNEVDRHVLAGHGARSRPLV
jgi:acrylyl-CoA reductase (NADPH)/3-hydroxypropionyl-CoA dehydratase/3-hydroxypropionyl-CoA synthetase